MILTVDILVTIAKKEVLLIRRAKPPFEDRLVMPGGHVEEGEDFRAAAARELQEEIGLMVNAHQLCDLMILDAPDRDPRKGIRVSHVFHLPLPNHDATLSCCAGSDAASIVIRRLDSLSREEMGFDHWLAIEKVRSI